MANYLIHHGIKGQQWGVQNGPPYPLDNGQKSWSEKKANRKIKQVNRVKTRAANRRNYRDSKYLNIGNAIVAGSAAALAIVTGGTASLPLAAFALSVPVLNYSSYAASAAIGEVRAKRLLKNIEKQDITLDDIETTVSSRLNGIKIGESKTTTYRRK